MKLFTTFTFTFLFCIFTAPMVAQGPPVYRIVEDCGRPAPMTYASVATKVVIPNRKAGPCNPDTSSPLFDTRPVQEVTIEVSAFSNKLSGYGRNINYIVKYMQKPNPDGTFTGRPWLYYVFVLPKDYARLGRQEVLRRVEMDGHGECNPQKFKEIIFETQKYPGTQRTYNNIY